MKKYSFYLWAFTVLIFLSFIGLMSYWYPVTLDEYFRWGGTVFKWEMIKENYVNIVPRISFFLSLPVFALGKWSFVVLNPLIQFVNCLLLFYILFLHLPNIHNLKDMPYFLTVLFMYIFFLAAPSEVLFWVSGAFNYSWTVLFLLLCLCLLRKIYARQFIFKDNTFIKCCSFLLGVIVGMSNECLAPVALGFTVCFALFCEYKKIKTPRMLSFLIFGLAFGCLVFFSAPAHYNKMNYFAVSSVSSASLINKLFFHIHHFNELFKAMFFLPVVTGLFLIIAALDKDKRNLKSEDFCYSLAMLLIAFLMAFILFVVPAAPVRAYYPSSVLFLLSFLFLVKYYIKVYGFDFSKYLCYLIIITSLFLLPRFVIPHYVLHLQEKARIDLNSGKHKKNRVFPYFVLAGPTSNLTISLMDPARRIHLGNEMYTVDATPPINW